MKVQDQSIDGVDVLIVGSGIMGAGVAATIRRERPDARILMVEGGRAIGTVPGLHLHESTDAEVWDRYNQRVSTGIQGFYASGRAQASGGDVASLAELEPGVHRLGHLREHSEQAPNAAAAWNVGGMGVHWTAATPYPWGAERFDETERWESDLDEAAQLLDVHPGPLGLTSPGRIVLDELNDLFGHDIPGRGPQTMPMAVQPRDGHLVRTGPSTIFPAIATGTDPLFRLREGTLAVRVENDGAHASGVTLRDVSTGTEETVPARTVIVCADTHRTPQLLFASGIRPEALGRYLNVHAFLSGRVLLDLERFGLRREELPRVGKGEFATDSLWLPHLNERQPLHGQIMNTVYVDEEDRALAYSVGISLYVPVESRAENRLVFDEHNVDVFGMPRITVEFAHSEADDRAIAAAREAMQRIAERFGAFDPEIESALLPEGSSLHQTGTVRSGDSDDGRSVCDGDGRVWGYENVYVAGNGVVPTALACNSTLTGMITAVRAARAAARSLTGSEAIA